MQKFFTLVQFFLENPYKEVHLRELAKMLHISPFAVKKYADRMLKEGLLIEERKANVRLFKANAPNLVFKHLKIAYSLQGIQKAGLVASLKSGIAGVSAIVLFGSMAKGEDDKNSDMDLVVIGTKKEKGNKLNIKREANLHLFSWTRWKKEAKENPAFYGDVIVSGIALYGELPIVP